MASDNDEKQTLSLNGIFCHQKKSEQRDIQHHKLRSFSTENEYSPDDACYGLPLKEKSSLTFSISKEEEHLLSQSELLRTKLIKKAGQQCCKYGNEREDPNLNKP